MAKKFVRGITDVKTINKQDYDTNNVNDLLSDGQYNYIHRKKGKTEEYHNLTDNIKTISSDNTELLSVTNNNKTTNTATLHPKHDAQKEQLLESTRNTVTINHGTNGTAEKTTVDTNPQKVLEHEKLKTGDGLTTSFNTDETTIMFKATKKPPETNLNTLGEGVVRGYGFSIDQVPDGNQDHSAAYVTINTSDSIKVQLYIRESGDEQAKIRLYYRFISNGKVTEWQQMVGDRGELDNQLTQKQNKLTAGKGIKIEGQTIDTNPQKVLEHENLISDSEYITLNHQSGENVTHIKTESLKQELNNLHETKQDVLTAGTGITIQGQTISATAGARLSSHIYPRAETNWYDAKKFIMENDWPGGRDVITTYVFDCNGTTAEGVLYTDLKEDIDEFIPTNKTISNGAISITNDGTNIKLINSAHSANVRQQATFTFYKWEDWGVGTAGGEGGGNVPAAK